MDCIINGLRINYITEGTGENVLLLHGWGANITLFNSMIELLKAKYTVTALDLPGFGKSDEPKTPFGVQEYVDFVLGFLKSKNISKTILIGHSLGGRIIIKMMAGRGLTLEVPKIVLIGSAGVKPKRSVKSKIKVRVYKLSKFVLANPLVKKAFPGALDKLKSKSGSADYRNASEMMRQCLVQIVNEDLQPYFDKNTIDTLIIWGENDTETPLSNAKIMESLMPNSGLAVIKNAGHYPYLEQVYTFNKILASYLKI